MHPGASLPRGGLLAALCMPWWGQDGAGDSRCLSCASFEKSFLRPWRWTLGEGEVAGGQNTAPLCACVLLPAASRPEVMMGKPL